MGKSVSNIIAKSTLYFLKEQGVNTDAIISQCHLSQYEINKRDGRLSDKQHLRFIKETAAYHHLWQEQMSQDDSPDQLINQAYALFPELVGYCLNQKTASDAVLGYIRNRIIIGNCDRFTLHQEDGQLAIHYVEDADTLLRDHSAIGNLRMIRELVRLYAPTASTTVSLRGSDDKDSKRLDDAFGCRCQFGQNANVIYFKEADLSAPVDSYLPLLHQNQHRQITKTVAALEYEQGFSSLIYSLLDEAIEQNNIADEASFMEHICTLVGMSRWTLNIRLNQENTNLSQLLKNVRLKKACLWLAETNLSVQDISERLRFSSLSVFSRFFSTHMGSSPLHYRRRLGARA